MAVRIGHASIDENKQAHSGVAGDQTCKEVCVRNWYNHSKGWVLLRCKDDAKRELIARAMEKACANNAIGYDQWQRDTLFNDVKSRGFDPAKTSKKVETDCSALVRVCIAYAYGDDVTGNFRTYNEPSILVRTGLFEKITSDDFCKHSDKLMRGDILCTKVSGHTVVVLDDGENASDEIPKEECNVKLRTLRRDCKGEDVKALQILLIGYGYHCGSYGADGDFGSATDKAVRAYQKAHSLTVDGIVGAKSWAELLGTN